MADDIFISYARVEREATLELAGKLWDLGYTTWYDARLRPGELFEEVIDAAVDQSRAVLTIWSKPALRSRWVKYESNRGLKQNKLLCTHTHDVDPGEFSGDFHGVNSVPVAEIKSVINRLIDMGVRPKDKSEIDLPPEAVIERAALAEWRNGLAQSWDVAALESFIANYDRAQLVIEVAQRRLLVAKARAAAQGDRQRERVFKLFEALEGGTDPDEFDFFLRKNFQQFPELAMPAAERLQELDPERFLEFAHSIPGAGERLTDFIQHAHRLIRLRDTKPEAAILRLDPGMHTATIKRIDVTTDGRTLATASDDKTVKLWSLLDGQLIRTLRPPIGYGDEGKLYAVALDPRGNWVAVGGWMEVGNSGEYISLFDVTSGAVLARLGPLPNVVHDLAASPDGARLAGGLGGMNGVWVWDVAQALTGKFEPSFVDTEYGDGVYGLAFGPVGTLADGQLASTCIDGYLRLYGRDGTRLTHKRASGGDFPIGVAFSPDGTRLAVGYQDTLCVDLLDVPTLELLAQPDVTELSDGNLASVAFIPPAKKGDAPWLTAGGGYMDGDLPIFAWSSAGLGPRARWPGASNSVMDLAFLPGGGLALGAGDPAFGTLAPDGTVTLWRGPAMADLRGKRFEHFTVNSDGYRLRFGLKEWGDTPVVFDIALRTLADAPQPMPELHAADTDLLKITGWKNTNTVTLTVEKMPGKDRKTLPLEQNEIARSLAIAQDASSFVLGADWQICRFDSIGKAIWKRPVPGTVWGVNLACEGRLILAAYGDGTIRWHRMEDGKELLALFIHLPEGPEGPREWILFTPEGYYDASSPEAEKLIGWHVNRGPDEAADFYPVETFASVYRRPDKIDAALEGV